MSRSDAVRSSDPALVPARDRGTGRGSPCRRGSGEGPARSAGRRGNASPVVHTEAGRGEGQATGRDASPRRRDAGGRRDPPAHPDDLAWYLGYDDPTAVDVAAVLAEAVHKAPERRLPALALAVVAVGAEDNLRGSGTRWGYSPSLALRWLEFLVGAGHELTEAEAALMDEARQQRDGDDEAATDG